MAVLSLTGQYPLHLLGWKAFQDLCVAISEECLRRPVQSFLPNNDAGRDGAFLGRWDGASEGAGESTIQCKFTSRPSANLTLSMLADEFEKVGKLAKAGLAHDYVILTNHPITGSSELAIRSAFERVGVGRCRVFGCDWIISQIKASPRLRMMVPRLYGLGDLSEILDARAYAQAQLILSAMGDDLQRLVVTEAHRNSVRAISEHNFVLLLGAPASGKSTIGASLAIGAADIWKSGTVRAASAEDIRAHLNPDVGQFFWIDDAWGNTQYQRQTAESWNQVFPLMQGAIKRGTRFLITSRDYIWAAAQRDLKTQALPVLNRVQVVINVEKLSSQEKAQILYNHLKMGDQTLIFRRLVKDILPEVAERRDFLPETARRFGLKFFAEKLPPVRSCVVEFFEKPEEFLLQTISNLSPDCQAAIAVVFLNGGKIRSPVSDDDLRPVVSAFAVDGVHIRNQLMAMNGSLMLLAQDELGGYWSYKHPTVSDAFARYVASNPELIEIYLRGARPESILREVVCAGVNIYGAPVIVPDALHELLAKRIEGVSIHSLISFLSYRANRAFAVLTLAQKPEILDRLENFLVPLKDDGDVSLLVRLHELELLPEELRLNFIQEVRTAALVHADASFLDDSTIGAVLREDEILSVLSDVENVVLPQIDQIISRIKSEWSGDYPPDDHFESFERSMQLFLDALDDRVDKKLTMTAIKRDVQHAVSEMRDSYEETSSTSAPVASSTPRQAALANVFRDIDE